MSDVTIIEVSQEEIAKNGFTTNLFDSQTMLVLKNDNQELKMTVPQFFLEQ